MAIVADKARPADTTTPDGSVLFEQSVADSHMNTVNTSNITTTIGAPVTYDARGGFSGNYTGIDFTQAGTDLSR